MSFVKNISFLSVEKYLQGVGCWIIFVNSEIQFRIAKLMVVACGDMNRLKAVRPASAGCSLDVILFFHLYPGKFTDSGNT